jgi:peptidoglycan/LPS O-acetylase OafA/YrhL
VKNKVASMQYRAEIDGLRAIAVVPVILFHAGFDLFQGGFVGVDVFFVISGYLITSIILTKKREGNFSLMGFYGRRARRILPALTIVLLVSVVLAFFTMFPSDVEDFSQSLMAATVFSSNIFFYLNSDYFDQISELRPLLHTWSLAVEEQYYVIFPIFLIATWKCGDRFVLAMLMVVALFSLGLAQWGSAHMPSATFYLLPTRIWELLIGVFVAYYLIDKKQNPSNQILSLLGFAMITFSVFAFDKHTPFPSLYALVPALGVALIILYTTSETLLYRLLSQKTLVGIGLISYSAYLWHQPLFAFSRIWTGQSLGMLPLMVLILLSFGLAYLSWRYIETPFRNREIINRRVFGRLVTFFTVFFIVIGVAGDATKPLYIAKAQGRSEYLFTLDYEELERQARVLTKRYAQQDLGGSFEMAKKKVLILGDSLADDFITSAKMSDKITTSFEFMHLDFDDLCFDPESDLPGCKNTREQFIENQELARQADAILIVVGFHPTTYVAGLKDIFDGYLEKLRVVSSPLFDPALRFVKQVAGGDTLPEAEMDRIYFRQKRKDVPFSNERAKDFATKQGIKYSDGYEIYCGPAELASCPFIRDGQLIIFDTSHKTAFGLEFYSKILEKWLFEIDL